MKFNITKSALLPAINLAKVAAARRSTMPILACALLEAGPDGISVHSSDSTCWLTTRVPCEPLEAGSVAIGVNTLHNIWRTLPEGDVAVTRETNGRTELAAGRTKMSVVSLSAADFPERPEEPDSYDTVSAAALSDLIVRVLPSVSPDEARVNLNGAQLDPNGKTATMVSTDGHRLTKYAAELDLAALGGRTVIVPRSGLEAVQKLLGDGDAELGIEGSYLFLRVGASTLAVRLHDVTFPPWQQVVPKDHRGSVTLVTADLRRAIQQAAVIAPEQTHTMAMTLRLGAVELRADNPDTGSVAIELPADVDVDGANGSDKWEMRIGLNAAYLLDAIAQAKSERVRLEFNSELEPVVVRPAGVAADDILAIVMPMRI